MKTTLELIEEKAAKISKRQPSTFGVDEEQAFIEGAKFGLSLNGEKFNAIMASHAHLYEQNKELKEQLRLCNIDQLNAEAEIGQGLNYSKEEVIDLLIKYRLTAWKDVAAIQHLDRWIK